MKMPENKFKRWLKQDNAIIPIGSWLMSASPIIAEAMSCTGLDFIVIDMEHSPLTSMGVTAILQAIAGSPCQSIVRIAWNDMIMVKQALDTGALTLMLPFIQNSDEARKAVSYCKYPPHGRRGVAGVTRASRYVTVANYSTKADEEIAIILQLETPQAIAELEQIAAVPGVDALFIGPGDLSANMGYLGDVANKAVQDVLKDTAYRCKKIGMACGIVGASSDMVKDYIAWGYDYVAIASDLAMLTTRTMQMITNIRGCDVANVKSGVLAY